MWWTVIGIVLALLALVAIHDVTQRKHAILRNFPIVGHFRYWLEAIGPELRQYIVTNNDEERPFSRDQRRWVYASSKRANNYFGFGTDNDLDGTPNYLIIKHSTLPFAGLQRTPSPHYPLPCAKVLGAARGRKHAFRPRSVVNISAMSYGSLSGAAVEAFNRGAKIAQCLHNTGEGGISPFHDKGGDLIWQIGTGYFGCREEDGSFSLERFKDNVQRHRVKAIEIKLSQGAKPGLGGILPAAKITDEIARIRGIPQGRDCISPPGHSAFHDADSLLDFVELLAAESGLPVGIKSAVGERHFWVELTELIAKTNRSVDFVVIDGGEGGTGAGPLTFTDHVSLPFRIGFSRIYSMFAERDLSSKIVFAGSGRLGFPDTALCAFALGCDMVHLAREPMMAIGCIQAQRCHTGHCPTGVATQNAWLTRGLEPTLKAQRLANYVITLRKELTRLSHACGVAHPGLTRANQLEILDDSYGSQTLAEVFRYDSTWGLPSSADQEAVTELMASGARDESS